MAGRRSDLHISDSAVADARVLAIDGVLDDTTYVPLRDAIVKTALDEPPALVVDVTRLTVRSAPAWAVFASARWQIAEWPDVPMGLVCAHEQGRNALLRNGITRYVPVYLTRQSAVRELVADGLRRYRRRARASLPANRSSIHRCREFTVQWLTAWARTDFTHVVSIVATELVEATLAEADAEFSFRVETDGSTVSVAVQHPGLAKTKRPRSPSDNVSGLDLVAATTRSWGSYATATGATVWAVVGPENRF